MAPLSACAASLRASLPCSASHINARIVGSDFNTLLSSDFLRSADDDDDVGLVPFFFFIWSNIYKVVTNSHYYRPCPFKYS